MCLYSCEGLRKAGVFFLFSLYRQFGPVFVSGWVCLPAGHFQSEPEYLGVDCGNEFPPVHTPSGLLSLFSVLTLK